jgi:hypothetical protein
MTLPSDSAAETADSLPREPHTPPPDPRFPIGGFIRPDPALPLPEGELENAIATIAELPTLLRNVIDDLHTAQIDTPYRAGGWTVRQLVHHLADSHMNAVIRVRLALTEDSPRVSGYSEKAWAELHDSHAAPVEWSLELIEAVHARWVMLLQSLTPEQWQRQFIHAERGPQTIEYATLLYAWHCRHHLAHITRLRMAMGW